MSVKWLLSIRRLQTIFREARHVKAILEFSVGETEFILGALISLVSLAGDDGKPEFTFYHKSLIDFLEDPDRSGELYVDRGSTLNPFLRDRFYQVLKSVYSPASLLAAMQCTDLVTDRGPQVTLPSNSLDAFLEGFCMQLPAYLAHNFKYDPSDVVWWTAHVVDENMFTLTFWDVHKHVSTNRSRSLAPWVIFANLTHQCQWYRCQPACKVWRKGIVRVCRAKGWHVPALMESLRDRFQQVNCNDEDWPDKYPLRPPSG